MVELMKLVLDRYKLTNGGKITPEKATRIAEIDEEILAITSNIRRVGCP